MKLSKACIANANVAINIRSGPGIGFSSVDLLPSGNQISVQEYESDKAGNLWFKIDKGWIVGTYLDFSINRKDIVNTDSLVLGLHDDLEWKSVTVNTQESIEYTQNGPSISVTGDSQTPNTASNKTNGANWGSTLGKAATNIAAGLFSGSISSVLGTDQSGILNQRLFGVPFQFIKSTDIRPSSSNVLQAVGVAFAENIMEEAPTLNLLAGTPLYLPDMDADTRKNTITTLTEAVTGGVGLAEKAATDLVNSGKMDTRFFEFKEANADYMMYVNTMCRSLAIFMGLGDLVVPGSSDTYSTYNWANYTLNNTFGGSGNNNGTSVTGGVGVLGKVYDSIFGDGSSTTNDPLGVSNTEGSNYGQWHSNVGIKNKESTSNSSTWTDMAKSALEFASAAISKKQSYVSFYIKPPSYSESFTNSTQGSTFKDFVKGISQSTKELAFVLQASGADPSAIQAATAGAVSSVSKAGEAVFPSSLSTIWKRLLRGASTVLTGGNMIFPDIWTESGYERNFNIDIHLSTPYGTPESIFLEIMVPMAHIMAFCLPRQSDGGVNAYTSPFLVRANCPGFFTCDMGIVRSCNIQKGGNGDGWSYMGFPTEMDISLSIVDLYNTMAMSTMDSVVNIYNFIWNTQFVDWLATNSGGVDMTTPFLTKKANLVTTLLKNTPSDVWSNTKMRVREWMRSNQIGIFKG